MNPLLELAHEVVRAFGQTEDLMKSPAFVGSLLEAGVRVALANSDEERRGIIGMEILRLKREAGL